MLWNLLKILIMFAPIVVILYLCWREENPPFQHHVGPIIWRDGHE